MHTIHTYYTYACILVCIVAVAVAVPSYPKLILYYHNILLIFYPLLGQ